MTDPALEQSAPVSYRENETDADGHRWHSPDYVRDWIRRYEREASPAYIAEHKQLLDAVLRTIPHDRSAALRILDVGAGWGRLARYLLEAFPSCHLVAHDFSQPMREAARSRLVDFAERIEFAEDDLEHQGPLTGIGDGFDIVVSTFTLHHVSEHRLGALFCELYALLRPGGVFVNLDRVRYRSAVLLQALWRMTGMGVISRALPALRPQFGADDATRKHGATRAGYLRMLRNAGFQAHAQRIGGVVLMVGRKASSEV